MDCNQEIWLAATLAEGKPVFHRPVRPSADQPGTLREQLEVIDCYLSDPTRLSDPEGAWDIARRLNISHARKGL